MKTYTVIRSTSGQIGCVVNHDGEATILRQCVYHSPSGFETGYAGSGPADLALSILADYFNATPSAVQHVIDKGFGCRCAWCNPGRCVDGVRVFNTGPEKALLYHQPFRNRFITPREIQRGFSYEIWGAEIDFWYGDLLRESKDPSVQEIRERSDAV